MFAAMASVVLASCVKNEPVATVEQGDLITFDAPVVGLSTKAQLLEGTDYPIDRPFGVYAYYTAGTYDGTNGTLYMKDVQATYQAADPTCYAVGNYYWPKTGKLSFFAYSPYTEAAATENAGAISLAYTVKGTPADQVDLLYSDWADNKTKDNAVVNLGSNKYNGIQLNFNHALSVVMFKFAGKTADIASNIKLVDADLKGVLSAGTLVCDFDADPKAQWTGQEEAADYQLLMTTSYQLTATPSTIGTDVNNLILLPQALPAGAKLVVDYQIKNPVDGSWIDQDPVEILLNTATVDDEPLTTWNMNTKYTYTILFDLDKIYLAPAVVENWTEVSASFPDQVL